MKKLLLCGILLLTSCIPQVKDKNFVEVKNIGCPILQSLEDTHIFLLRCSTSNQTVQALSYMNSHYDIKIITGQEGVQALWVIVN